MARRYGSHPLADTCLICDEPLGATGRRKWRGAWAHLTCILRKRGE